MKKLTHAGIVARTILVLLLTHQGVCQADLVDFVNGTWDHSAAGGSSTSTGWDSAYTLGSTTVSGTTVTLQSITHGTAATSSGNLTLSSIGATTGFKFGNDGVTDTNTTSLLNYQEWRFTFDSAVENLTWTVYDVDSFSGGDRWIDAISAEAWFGSTGALGTGSAVNWDISGSELLVDSSTYAVDFVRRDHVTYGHANVGTADAEGIAVLDFAGAIQGLSLYFFNDGQAVGTHNIVNDGTFSITSTPEPSSAVLYSHRSCALSP